MPTPVSASTCVFSVLTVHGPISSDSSSPRAAFTLGSVLRGHWWFPEHSAMISRESRHGQSR